jgi:hypothetical protein
MIAWPRDVPVVARTIARASITALGMSCIDLLAVGNCSPLPSWTAERRKVPAR